MARKGGEEDEEEEEAICWEEKANAEEEQEEDDTGDTKGKDKEADKDVEREADGAGGAACEGGVGVKRGGGQAITHFITFLLKLGDEPSVAQNASTLVGAGPDTIGAATTWNLPFVAAAPGCNPILTMRVVIAGMRPLAGCTMNSFLVVVFTLKTVR